MRESRLTKIGRHRVELPPTDTHFVSVRWIDANGRLICSIANNVVAVCIDVDLVTRVRTELRDQSGRGGGGWGQRRRIIIFFHWLLRQRLGCQGLTRSNGDYREKNNKNAQPRPWHRFTIIPLPASSAIQKIVDSCGQSFGCRVVSKAEFT